MSGDGHPKDQPLKFYSEEMTATKRALLNHPHTNYVLEIEHMLIQARWRNSSPLRE